MKGSQLLLRIISSVLILCILTSTSAEYAFAEKSHQAPTNTTSLSISIPKEFGTIEEFVPSAKCQEPRKNLAHGSWCMAPLIIYIQDAHDSLEAQVNIAHIIHFLVAKHAVKTVFEEGYEGEVPTDKYFGFIKDPVLRQKVSYFLLDKLRLGGAEYAHINRKTDFKLMGADSLKLQNENIGWYQRNTALRKETQEDLKALCSEIAKLANQHFPKKLKEWTKLKEKVERNEINLIDYLRRMDDLSLRRRKSSFFVIPAKAGIHGSPLKACGDDTLCFLRKMDEFEEQFAYSFFTNDRDKKIFQYYKNLLLLEKLNNIKLLPEEYKIVKTSLLDLNTNTIADFIVSQTGKSIVLSKQWEKNIQNAIRFYETAHKRDKFIESILLSFPRRLCERRSAACSFGAGLPARRKRESIENGSPIKAFGDDRENTAILVFGGFHRENIKQILEQNDFSYVIISPRINSLSPRHQDYYKKIMSGGHHAFEMSLLIPKAMKQWGVYSLTFGPRVIRLVYDAFQATRSEVRDDLSGQLAVEQELKTTNAGSPQGESILSRRRLRLDSNDFVINSILRRALYLTASLPVKAKKRNKIPGVKAGGHTSSATPAIPMLTALHFEVMRGQDRFALKPHAQPAYMALMALLGRLGDTERATKILGNFRETEFDSNGKPLGFQAYPSQKDPLPAAIPTGSVGLQGSNVLGLAAIYKYAMEKGFDVPPDMHFWAYMGDSETDEGNLREMLDAPFEYGFTNVTHIIGYDAQSLDGHRTKLNYEKLKRMYHGWKIIEVRWGRKAKQIFEKKDGDILQKVLEKMEPKEFHELIRRDKSRIREVLLQKVRGERKQRLEKFLSLHLKTDEALYDILTNLGGHDFEECVAAGEEARNAKDRPTVIITHILKGWGIPSLMAREDNHGLILTEQELDSLRKELGLKANIDSHPLFPKNSRESKFLEKIRRRIESEEKAYQEKVRQNQKLYGFESNNFPERMEVIFPPNQQYRDLSTHVALNNIFERLMKLAEKSTDQVTAEERPLWQIAQRIVGVFPDVARSTLAEAAKSWFHKGNLSGRHFEVGIAEMKAWSIARALGWSHEMFGIRFFPWLSIYAAFMFHRASDEAKYTRYVGAPVLAIGHLAGLGISHEGAAHQEATDAVHADLLKGTVWELDANELEYVLPYLLKSMDQDKEQSLPYLRVSVAAVNRKELWRRLRDQKRFEGLSDEEMRKEWAQEVLRGGYRLVDHRGKEDYDPSENVVNLITSGRTRNQALKAAAILERNYGIYANVIIMTSPTHLVGKLRKYTKDSALYRRLHRKDQKNYAQLRYLIPREERDVTPLIGIADGSTHLLSRIPAILGISTGMVLLGAEEVGRSTSLEKLDRHHKIYYQHIVASAMRALKLRDSEKGSVERFLGATELRANRRRSESRAARSQWTWGAIPLAGVLTLGNPESVTPQAVVQSSASVQKLIDPSLEGIARFREQIVRSLKDDELALYHRIAQVMDKIDESKNEGLVEELIQILTNKEGSPLKRDSFLRSFSLAWLSRENTTAILFSDHLELRFLKMSHEEKKDLYSQIDHATGFPGNRLMQFFEKISALPAREKSGFLPSFLTWIRGMTLELLEKNDKIPLYLFSPYVGIQAHLADVVDAQKEYKTKLSPREQKRYFYPDAQEVLNYYAKKIKIAEDGNLRLRVTFDEIEADLDRLQLELFQPEAIFHSLLLFLPEHPKDWTSEEKEFMLRISSHMFRVVDWNRKLEDFIGAGLPLFYPALVEDLIKQAIEDPVEARRQREWVFEESDSLLFVHFYAERLAAAKKENDEHQSFLELLMSSRGKNSWNRQARTARRKAFAEFAAQTKENFKQASLYAKWVLRMNMDDDDRHFYFSELAHFNPDALVPYTAEITNRFNEKIHDPVKHAYILETLLPAYLTAHPDKSLEVLAEDFLPGNPQAILAYVFLKLYPDYPAQTNEFFLSTRLLTQLNINDRKRSREEVTQRLQKSFEHLAQTAQDFLSALNERLEPDSGTLIAQETAVLYARMYIGYLNDHPKISAHKDLLRTFPLFDLFHRNRGSDHKVSEELLTEIFRSARPEVLSAFFAAPHTLTEGFETLVFNRENDGRHPFSKSWVRDRIPLPMNLSSWLLFVASPYEEDRDKHLNLFLETMEFYLHSWSKFADEMREQKQSMKEFLQSYPGLQHEKVLSLLHAVAESKDASEATRSRSAGLLDSFLARLDRFPAWVIQQMNQYDNRYVLDHDLLRAIHAPEKISQNAADGVVRLMERKDITLDLRRQFLLRSLQITHQMYADKNQPWSKRLNALEIASRIFEGGFVLTENISVHKPVMDLWRRSIGETFTNFSEVGKSELDQVEKLRGKRGVFRTLNHLLETSLKLKTKARKAHTTFLTVGMGHRLRTGDFENATQEAKHLLQWAGPLSEEVEGIQAFVTLKVFSESKDVKLDRQVLEGIHSGWESLMKEGGNEENRAFALKLLQRLRAKASAKPSQVGTRSEMRRTMAKVNFRRVVRREMDAGGVIFVPYYEIRNSGSDTKEILISLASQIHGTAKKMVIYGADMQDLELADFRKLRVETTPVHLREAYDQFADKSGRNVNASTHAVLLRKEMGLATSKMRHLLVLDPHDFWAAYYLLNPTESANGLIPTNGVYTAGEFLRSELRDFQQSLVVRIAA